MSFASRFASSFSSGGLWRLGPNLLKNGGSPKGKITRPLSDSNISGNGSNDKKSPPVRGRSLDDVDTRRLSVSPSPSLYSDSDSIGLDFDTDDHASSRTSSGSSIGFQAKTISHAFAGDDPVDETFFGLFQSIPDSPEKGGTSSSFLDPSTIRKQVDLVKGLVGKFDSLHSSLVLVGTDSRDSDRSFKGVKTQERSLSVTQKFRFENLKLSLTDMCTAMTSKARYLGLLQKNQ